MTTSSASATSDSAGEEPVDPVVLAARRDFAIPYLYPIQRLAIANILEGVCQLVVLPTGGGKSLCFQLPALLLAGLTVVVTPLLSLMADQLARLRGLGLPAAALRGGQAPAEREALLRSGTPLRILYTTPETLGNPAVRRRLAAIGIEHLVVDEAHCVSEWGRTFRPAYLGLGGVLAELAPRTVTAFTATASPPVIEDVGRVLFAGRAYRTVMGNPDRPNLRYAVIPVVSRLRALGRLVGEGPAPVLVFARTRPGVQAVARALARRFPRMEVRFYHAGLTAAERAAVESWFLPSPGGVLVATSAYGMGIDKPDIRTVLHAEVPYSVESYLQESGRAGRDGRPARAALLAGPADERFLATLPGELERGRYRRVLDYALGPPGCRRRFLLGYLGLEEAHCAGCDACDGTAARRPEGEEQVLRFVRRHRRRYSLRELGQVLAGRPCYEGARKGLDRVAGFGLLGDWEPEDIDEALTTMVESGRLAVPARGFWKNRVTTGGRDSWTRSLKESLQSMEAARGT
jgi:ATP-dependent DNA helicase RecQ